MSDSFRETNARIESLTKVCTDLLANHVALPGSSLYDDTLFEMRERLKFIRDCIRTHFFDHAGRNKKIVKSVKLLYKFRKSFKELYNRIMAEAMNDFECPKIKENFDMYWKIREEELRLMHLLRSMMDFRGRKVSLSKIFPVHNFGLVSKASE